jgi:hypothetical protein
MTTKTVRTTRTTRTVRLSRLTQKSVVLVVAGKMQCMKPPRTKLSYEGDRGRMLVRVINILIDVSTRPRHYAELMEKYGVSQKTILRDIRILEDVGCPVTVSYGTDENADSERRAGVLRTYVKIDKHWIQRFVRITD